MSFNTEQSCDAVVHFHHLGEKEEGKEFYKNVTWADVTINGVDLDTTLYNEMKCMEAEERMRDAERTYHGGKVEVHPRKMSLEINESSSSSREFTKGDGIKKMYVRKRTIPQGVRKKYPIKPWDQSKQEKKKSALERVTDEIEGDDTPVAPLQPIIYDESIIDGWFNYGDELNEIPDQLVLSKDPVTIDGSPKWIFHSMETGEGFSMDFDASIKDVYHKWMKIHSNL
jgi:hypothetical protein